jgi:AcrR family transcriptional regulator
LRVADPVEQAALRKPRADAERNRLRLLEAAKAAFAEKGAGASLDEIARSAGVGAGTLYRHFPTRDALIEAVYRKESAQLIGSAAHLSETRAPLAALRDWLVLFVDYLATKRDMAEALNSFVGGVSDLQSASSIQVKQAISDLVDRAVRTGDIRQDVDLRALAGVATIGVGPDGEMAAKRMVDILIAGLRADR